MASTSGALLHALVARDHVVLAEHSVPGTNQSYGQGELPHALPLKGQIISLLFLATQTILSKIPPNDSKLTYAGQ